MSEGELKKRIYKNFKINANEPLVGYIKSALVLAWIDEVKKDIEDSALLDRSGLIDLGEYMIIEKAKWKKWFVDSS